MAPINPVFDKIPRLKLLFDHPTIIQPLPRLTKDLDCGATIWISREDSNSGLAFGGNKARKLEYVVADAINQGADTLVTTGGGHNRTTCDRQPPSVPHWDYKILSDTQVALYPRPAVKPASAEYDYAGNIQLNEILGAETFPVGTREEDVLETLRRRGQKPYSIPSGASMHPLGGLGFARWAFEGSLSERSSSKWFLTTIVVATGSGSTIGGIIAGFQLAEQLGRLESRKRILGINVLGGCADEMTDLVTSIARTTAEKIGADPRRITKKSFE